jgi:O-antigen/teichoic acid export membrane protein
MGELVRKGSISLFVKILAAGTVFATNVLVSRALGAEEAGYYFLGFAILTILSAASRLGFDRIATRYVSGFSASSNLSGVCGTYKFVVFWVTVTSLCISVLLYAFSAQLSHMVFQKPEMKEVLELFSLALAPITLTYLHGFFHQGLKNMIAMQLCFNFGLNLVFLVAVAIGFVSHDHLALHAFLVLFVGSSYLACFVAVISWVRKEGLGLAEITKSKFRIPKVWNIALPLWLSTLLTLVANWSAVLIVGYLASSSEVAIFTNATRTAMLIVLVLQAVNSIVGPKLGEAFGVDDMLAVREISVLGTRITILIGTPIVAFMVTFSELIMSMFGSGFREGATVLVILAIGQFVNVITGPVAWILVMGKGERMLLLSHVGSATVMVVLCFVLIPPFGLAGAAIAQATGLSVQMIMCTFAVKYLYGFFPIQLRSI